MFKNKEYILAIVRYGGFSKASEKLYISQPSLSASVKRIESKLSTPIFDRTTTPISLTDIGREYVKCAVEIEQREQDFELYITNCVNLTAGEIKIGGSSLFSSFLLPTMIERFKKDYPNVSVRIFENNTKNLLRELAEGNLDIIIDNAVINTENISSTVHLKETILLAVPSSIALKNEILPFALSANDIRSNSHLLPEYDVDITDFGDIPFIMLHSENDTGKRAMRFFKKRGLAPNVLFKIDQQITSYNISLSGMGATFVSDILVKNVPPSPNMRYFRLNDPDINRNVYLYRKSNRYYSAACKKFMEYKY